MGKVIPIRLDDQEARERIRTSLDESLLVEAAAGTGKTTELIRRLVAVLASGRAQPDGLVAVTFTRRAAGELKLRLRQELDNALARARNGAAPQHSLPQTTATERLTRQTSSPSESAATQVRNLENAIAHLEEAHIGTIHSFCAEILRERPVEANVDPAFRELSDREAQRLYRRAFRHWSQERLTASESESPGLHRCLCRLAARGTSDGAPPLRHIEQAGWNLAEWRDFSTPWQRRPFERELEVDALVEKVRKLWLLAKQCPYPNDELVQALRPARDLVTWVERAESVSKRDYNALEGRLVVLLKDLRKRSKKGHGPFAEGVTREAVVAARDQLIEALESFKRRADADLAALLQAEMRSLLERYDDLKNRNGALDFVDLLLKARDVIRGRSDVRRYLQERFTHIFVDEFQDTDPLQAEILLLLAADDPAETNWLRARPVPGKLFLVGDPKQSVYRFRRADLVLYLQLREALRQRGVGFIHLTRSFRAVPSLQECVNAAFAPEMVEDRAAGQAGYVPLRPFREERKDGQPTVVVLPVPRPYGERRVETKAIDQSLPPAIAAFVRWLITESRWTVTTGGAPQPIRPRHIALLFRRQVSYRTDMTRDYLRELEAREIPHLLVGGKSFHRREEVETMRAALAAIEWPDDELSVYATLRGSLFALADSLLLRFRERCGRLHPFRPLPDSLPAEFSGVTEALKCLAELHRRRNQRPFVETVNALLEATRAHAAFGLRPGGAYALANVYRIADLAREFELAGGISFRAFVEELEDQAEREESPEAPVLEEGADGVRLMTVHAAKGLEFPVVILADITAKLSRQESDLFIDPQTSLCAMPLAGCAPWNLVDRQAEEQARDHAEGVRVAYVAATRARDLLVIPAVGDGPSDGWVSPLHKSIYPPLERRRAPEPAPRCPAFGPDSVLERPEVTEEPPRFNVAPGLHKPERGAHRVVWWDPSVLRLKVPPRFGVRQWKILSKGTAGARQSVEQYEAWKARRSRTLHEGVQPEFEVLAVTETSELPPAPPAVMPVEVLIVPKPANRPSGRRFGTLVHALLNEVGLVLTLAEHEPHLRRLAGFHGRILGCPADEIAAAVDAVAAAWRHPLLRRAQQASRCHRELPLVMRRNGKLIEGIVDLAFLEDGQWHVVDFKTDADWPGRRAEYERQVQWYVYGMTQLTGAAVKGWLLGL
jgi:ATP-dependent helicase/nuclease subunit A